MLSWRRPCKDRLTGRSWQWGLCVPIAALSPDNDGLTGRSQNALRVRSQGGLFQHPVVHRVRPHFCSLPKGARRRGLFTSDRQCVARRERHWLLYRGEHSAGGRRVLPKDANTRKIEAASTCTRVGCDLWPDDPEVTLDRLWMTGVTRDDRRIQAIFFMTSIIVGVNCLNSSAL